MKLLYQLYLLVYWVMVQDAFLIVDQSLTLEKPCSEDYWHTTGIPKDRKRMKTLPDSELVEEWMVWGKHRTCSW